MIKILFFIPSLSEGGAEKVLCNLVNNMDQTMFDITVQTVEYYNPDEYLAEGIHYKSIFHSSNGLNRKLHNYWYRFCTEFKLTYPLYIKGDYDIEVAYLECGATKVIAASTNKKAVKIAWVHCDLEKKGICGQKVASYYSKYHYVVCVSEDVEKIFRKLFPDVVRTKVLHNVIDEDEIIDKSLSNPINRDDSERTEFVAVGRLTVQKNYSMLIDVCSRLYKEGYNYRLNILGDGPEKISLEDQIDRAGLKNVVCLKGYIKNPYPWIKAADWLVCSSLYEGISTVVQEAMILGVPVITSPCTGMKELLGDSEFGIISEPGEQGLYDSMKAVMDYPEKLVDYLQLVRVRQQNIGKRTVLNQTQNWFAECVKKKS